MEIRRRQASRPEDILPRVQRRKHALRENRSPVDSAIFKNSDAIDTKFNCDRLQSLRARSGFGDIVTKTCTECISVAPFGALQTGSLRVISPVAEGNGAALSSRRFSFRPFPSGRFPTLPVEETGQTSKPA